MGKYLKIGGEPGGERWTLPDHADVAKLRKKIANAMEAVKALNIPVVVGKDQMAELVVNGRALLAVLVWEDQPVGGGMTIID